jgi:hypothetical protein
MIYSPCPVTNSRRTRPARSTESTKTFNRLQPLNYACRSAFGFDLFGLVGTNSKQHSTVFIAAIGSRPASHPNAG